MLLNYKAIKAQQNKTFHPEIVLVNLKIREEEFFFSLHNDDKLSAIKPLNFNVLRTHIKILSAGKKRAPLGSHRSLFVTLLTII